MHYAIFGRTGNLVESFESEESARKALDHIVDAEPKAPTRSAVRPRRRWDADRRPDLCSRRVRRSLRSVPALYLVLCGDQIKPYRSIYSCEWTRS